MGNIGSIKKRFPDLLRKIAHLVSGFEVGGRQLLARDCACRIEEPLRNQGQAETSVHGGTGSAWGYVETGEATMQVQSSRSNSSGPNRLLEKRQQNSER